MHAPIQTASTPLPLSPSFHPSLHRHPSQDAWYMSRKAVLAVVSALVLTPLSMRESMASLGLINAVGVGSVAVFALALAWLGAEAVVQVRGWEGRSGAWLHAVAHTLSPAQSPTHSSRGRKETNRENKVSIV
jgi:hypothetical protein